MHTSVLNLNKKVSKYVVKVTPKYSTGGTDWTSGRSTAILHSVVMIRKKTQLNRM
jgi:hypothetical protein